MASLSDQEFKTLLKTRCIGLTGGIATGKSTVGTILRGLGFTVIDADQLARDVVKPGEPAFTEIAKHFGKAVIAANGELDRDTLRERVMTHESDRKALEAITHPAIQQRLREMTALPGFMGARPVFFYEAALIFETGRDGLFREIWATICPKNTQIERLRSRSGLTPDEALKIISAQMPADLKASKARHAIETDCPLEKLAREVEDLVKTVTA